MPEAVYPLDAVVPLIPQKFYLFFVTMHAYLVYTYTYCYLLIFFMNKALLVFVAFLVVMMDVFCRLSEKLTNWAWFSKFPALIGAFLCAVTVGALVAHILLSLLHGTDMRKDIVQAEPIEEFIH